MNWKVKLILMNCAVAAALYYRWSHGAAIAPLMIIGVVMFLLVNGLILLTRTKAASGKR